MKTNVSGEFIKWCIHSHDVYANQKYGEDDKLEYSFHLNLVATQSKKWEHLLANDTDRIYVYLGSWGHDLIEDARRTYNDVVKAWNTKVADIIYCCTDEKGKTRDERHDYRYYKELSENRLAVYVKLCDIIANVTYSLLTNSSMYKKYGSEYEKMKRYLYREEFKPMFDHLEKLLSL